MSENHQVRITINGREVEVARNTTGGQILAVAGFDPTQYELFQLEGKHDSSAGTSVAEDQSIKIDGHEFFRAVPRNINFG